MMYRIGYISFVMALAAVGCRAAASEIEFWTTHSLDKSFPDTVKPEGASAAIVLKAARNESEDAQILIRTPEGVEVTRASFSVTDLEGRDGARIASENVSARWVWYTYVLNNPKDNKDPSTYLRKAPAFFPDAFLEDAVTRIRDSWTQPLWVTVRVPKGTPPGDYAGVVKINLMTYTHEEHHFEVPVSVSVWPFTLPDENHLRHTEWFWPQSLVDYYHLEPWSEKHWEWIGRVAEDMGRHRQDMILTPLADLVALKQDEAGNISADFSRLDRWIETFRKSGVTWIEGGHAAARESDWFSPFVWIRFAVTGPDGRPLNTANPAAEANVFFRSHQLGDTAGPGMTHEQFEPYAKALFQLVHAHLKEKGWANRYVQHIGDEPVGENQESWKQRAATMREWIPGVPIIDAVMLEGLEGLIDIRVPQIQDTKPAGERPESVAMWSYVCLYPQEAFPNRFLDYPSIRNRILFWLSWSRDLTGFLHWGYNYWQTWSNVPAVVPVSPWLDATGASIYVADRMPLPAGDPFLVYPGRASICGSIRWEVVRKGMEDYEYLYMLGQAAANPQPGMPAEAVEAARGLLDRVKQEIAVAPDNYTRDDALLLRTREEAGTVLSALMNEK